MSQLQKSNGDAVKKYLANPAVKKRVEDLLDDRASNFITSVTSMVSADNKLAECEPTSLIMACLTAAALELPVNKNLGFAHIVPYRNNKSRVTEAQFQMGWKGFVQLAQRTGQYETIAATPVYENQIVRQDPLEGNEYNWDARVNDKVIGYVAKFKLTTGFRKELYMSQEDVEKHATKYSQAYKSSYGPWKDNFEAMALKTVVKLLISKWGPMSVDMQNAIQKDQAIIKEDNEVSYIDGEAVENEKATEGQKAAIIEGHTGEVEDISDEGLAAAMDETEKKGKKK